MIPLIVGTALALGALSFVLYPLLFGTMAGTEIEVPQSATFSRSPRDGAVDALREIEFDRATGKLSDSDYAALKLSYTRKAIDAMRSGAGATCEKCGPRPEADARFCSNCGAAIAA